MGVACSKLHSKETQSSSPGAGSWTQYTALAHPVSSGPALLPLLRPQFWRHPAFWRQTPEERAPSRLRRRSILQRQQHACGAACAGAARMQRKRAA
jgi:hypothetical protein